jgi:type IV pilus assembly protein PilY1
MLAANQTEADKIIAYTKGVDQAGYRSRTVTYGSDTRVWKLGDIISSTPKLQSSVQLNTYNLLPSSGGYKDLSYNAFVNRSEYSQRGMVYVGANDGMLHAFRLGNLDVTPNMSQKATLSGTNLGEEYWAFIPRNALPYLRYLGDTNYTGYNHLYFVDGSVMINDVSIGKPAGCSETSYADCAKDTANGSNWRTVLIGSMGLGGATKIKGTGCKTTTCVETPALDPADNTKGLGYSSYFALDVTDQYFDADGNLAAAPKLLWEFSDPALGFSTSGAAFVRIAATTSGAPDKLKNGHWYAVVASGPTGRIDSTKFTGISNQPLSIFVLDMETGTLLRKIDTLEDGTSQITNAFAGVISASPIDVERWNMNLAGNYQDNALYIGYTQYDSGTGKWTNGGVVRLVTKEDPNPNNWVLSKVIDGVGAVTTNISRLQDRKNHNLWLYFGTGRYTYPMDDLATGRIIAGVKEPCYTATDTIDTTCTTKINSALFPYTTALVDQSTIQPMANTDKGWYINLGPQDTANNIGAERSITDPVPLTNGAVFFTTFQPSSDVCGFGGNSYLWGVNYKSGGVLSAAAKQAKALIQVSTGSFEQIDIGTAMTAEEGRRTEDAMVGKPPVDPPPIVTKANLKPVKRILHIQEQ